MMLFDVDAALAEIVAHDTATPAAIATNPPEVRPVSQMSPLSQRRTAENKPTPQPSRPVPSPPEPDAYPYGRSFDGNPKTWTGRVVSLDQWRGLSAWERHGPGARLYCGICQAWMDAFPACHGGKA